MEAPYSDLWFANRKPHEDARWVDLNRIYRYTGPSHGDEVDRRFEEHDNSQGLEKPPVVAQPVNERLHAFDVRHCRRPILGTDDLVD